VKSLLLETYIKRCIIVEQQRQNSNNIIRDIVNKFSSEYALRPRGPGLGPAAVALAFALASNQQDAFWKRYNTDTAFRDIMKSSYTYKKRDIFDFWQNSDEFREYLKPELKSAEVILVEQDRASALSLKDIRNVLEIAENVEEFIEMVKIAR